MRIPLLAACGVALLCAPFASTIAADSAKSPAGAWWKPATGGTLEFPPTVFGPQADVQWSITAGATAKEGGPFTVEDDPLLARSVLVCGMRALTLEGRTSYGEVEIDCRVRLGVTAEKPTANFTLVPAK